MPDFQTFEGEPIIEPGGYAKAKFRPSGEPFIDTGTMLLIGTSEGGVPHDDTTLPEAERMNTFEDINEARDVLRSGDLLDAADIAFNPIAEPNFNGARKLICIRSNQATKSAITLQSNSLDSMDVKSKDYGKHTKNTSIQVDIVVHPIHSINGAVISISKDGNDEESGNLYLPLMSISYAGAEATADVTYISSTGIFSIDGTGNIFNADVADFKTIGELAAAIEADSDFTIEIYEASFKTNLMDDIEVADAMDVKAAPGIPAGTYETQLRYLNALSSYTTATQNGALRKPLDSLPKAFLTGGTTTIPIVGDWTEAIRLSDFTEAFYQIELSGDPAIAQINKSSVKNSNKVSNRRERLGGSGNGDYQNTTYDVRRNESRALNLFLYIYGASPLKRYDSAGVLRTFEPKFLTVWSMAINAGNGPQTASTFKALDAIGNPEIYSQPEKNQFIRAGCQIVTHNPRTNVPRVVRSVTTHQGPDLIPSEMSMVATALAMVKTFRILMEEAFVGVNLTANNRGLIEVKAREILDSFVEDGFLTGDDVQKAYVITKIDFVGDKVTIVQELTEVPVLNFIFSLMNISAFGL